MQGIGFRLTDYPYLLIVCGFMTLFVAGVWLCPRRHRRAMILSALLSMPFSLASFFFDPAYWHPVRIIGDRIGIEDMLFSFSTGGIVWLFSIWPIRRKMSTALNAARILKKTALLCATLVVIYTIVSYSGVGVMAAVLISTGLFAPGVLYFRPSFKRVFLAGIVGFTVFYLVMVKLCFMFFSDFINLWNLNALWGFFLWGIPIEEIAWAAIFGGTWPVVTAYIFDLHDYESRRERFQLVKLEAGS